QKETCTVDVRHRYQKRMAEHCPRSEMMRKLIDRRRREIVLRLQNFQQFPAIQNRTEVMHGRIALIYADSIASKLLLHLTKPPSRFIQRLIPADRLPLAIRFPYGMSK